MRGALARGQSGVREIEGIDTSGLRSWAAGQVGDFDDQGVMDAPALRRVPRMVHLALAASREATESAALRIDADSFGNVITHTKLGSFTVKISSRKIRG